MAWRPLDIGKPKIGNNTIRVPNVPLTPKAPRLNRIGGLPGIASRQDPTRGMPKPLSIGALMKAARPPKKFAPLNHL